MINIYAYGLIPQCGKKPEKPKCEHEVWFENYTFVSSPIKWGEGKGDMYLVQTRNHIENIIKKVIDFLRIGISTTKLINRDMC